MTNSLATMTTPALLRAAGKEIDRARKTLDATRHRRATPDNLIDLGTDLRASTQATERALAYWAVAARNEGHSWATIAAAMGVTRQGARQRFNRFVQDTALEL